ncbi:MAG: outer membrane lipoprotein [Acidiferrobacterales bacterium]
MKAKITILIAVALSSVSLAGCATGNYNANSYSSGLSQQAVVLGHVLAVHTVTDRPSGPANAGGLIGLIAGAALGSQIGQGAGTAIAEGLGGLAGAVTGSHLENQAETHKALQVTVRLDSGEVVAIVEEGRAFHAGERVQIVYSQSGKTRVMPL